MRIKTPTQNFEIKIFEKQNNKNQSYKPLNFENMKLINNFILNFGCQKFDSTYYDRNLEF